MATRALEMAPPDRGSSTVVRTRVTPRNTASPRHTPSRRVVLGPADARRHPAVVRRGPQGSAGLFWAAVVRWVWELGVRRFEK